jgi:RNA polymerase sigma factor (sigma-70 family)
MPQTSPDPPHRVVLTLPLDHPVYQLLASVAVFAQLVAFAMRRCHLSHADAVEVVMEARVYLLSKMAHGWTPTYPRAFLFATVRKRARNAARWHRRHPAASHAELPGVFADRRRRDDRDRPGDRDMSDESLLPPELRRALARLSEEDRWLLLTRHVDGWSIDRIAAARGIKPASVSSRLSRIAHKLRESCAAGQAG